MLDLKLFENEDEGEDGDEERDRDELLIVGAEPAVEVEATGGAARLAFEQKAAELDRERIKANPLPEPRREYVTSAGATFWATSCDDEEPVVEEREIEPPDEETALRFLFDGCLLRELAPDTFSLKSAC